MLGPAAPTSGSRGKCFRYCPAKPATKRTSQVYFSQLTSVKFSMRKENPLRGAGVHEGQGSEATGSACTPMFLTVQAGGGKTHGVISGKGLGV